MNLSEITEYHKSHWIDLYQAKHLIWKPTIKYSKMVDFSVEQEQFYLYAAG